MQLILKLSPSELVINKIDFWIRVRYEELFSKSRTILLVIDIYGILTIRIFTVVKAGKLHK